MTHTTQNEECKHEWKMVIPDELDSSGWNKFHHECTKCSTKIRVNFKENQQNYEEWEKRFDDEFPYDTLVSAHQDWTYDAIKEFIREERQEASKKGYIQGGDDTLKAVRSAMEREKKQAVDKYINVLKTYIYKDDYGYFIVDADNIDDALEVYEGK